MIKLERETGLCIKAFYNVFNELGYGFLEKVYEKSETAV
ncbi:MAG: GxxExxY protein [bacterium]|nr:GxxExxY protein [bacterium]